MSSSPGIKRRLVCLLYEALVVFSILIIGFLLPQIVLSGFGWSATPRGLWLHLFALLMLYFVWCWLNGGQTLPMKTWKLRLVNTDGSALRPLQAVLRYLIAWPSIMCFGIGILWALVDKDRQFLHDRLAGTKILSTTLD